MKSLTKLAEELGRPKETIAALLPKVNETLWWTQGRGITVTEEAEFEIKRLLLEPPAQDEGTPEQLPALPNTPQEGQEEIMRADRCPLNARLLIALRSNGEKADVAVRDNTKMKAHPYFVATFKHGHWQCHNFKPLNPSYVMTLPEWAHMR